jgi:hypothetical protein
MPEDEDDMLPFLLTFLNNLCIIHSQQDSHIVKKAVSESDLKNVAQNYRDSWFWTPPLSTSELEMLFTVYGSQSEPKTV